jgi:hypothetical protein
MFQILISNIHGAHFAQLHMCMCSFAGFQGGKELETLNAFLGAANWTSDIADWKTWSS